ncbi:NAD(P)H-dependent oxidoreductase [Prochlorococcus sp. MIT 1223]|uniref:NADPH-dependent FMN reductase n=1 Tax=Prochlorococcus sp. MIT 1223 TaxID=3096217 RepID=UPI002A74903C|nr:NAD(P)H-dependent oxidoreductase [Prochlorococcus sp. MIT 1223]
MDTTQDLLIISASNGENLKLATRFLQRAEKQEIGVELIDLTELSLPLFNPRTHAQDAITAEIDVLSKKLRSAPRWVICAPEYNGSIPPVLTSVIAWLSTESDDFRSLFNGRPIALASFSGGGCMELLLSMRIQFTHLGAQVVGRQLASNSQKQASEESIDDLLKRIMQMKPLKL